MIIEKLLSVGLWIVKMIEFIICGFIYFMLCGLAAWLVALVFPQIYMIVPQIQGNEVLWGGLVGLAGHLFCGNYGEVVTKIPEVKMVEVDDDEKREE